MFTGDFHGPGGTLTMATPKAPKTGKRGRPKVDRPSKRPGISLKGSEQWLEWIRGLADHMDMPATVVIDQALKAYARANDYKKEFPGR